MEYVSVNDLKDAIDKRFQVAAAMEHHGNNVEKEYTECEYWFNYAEALDIVRGMIDEMPKIDI